MKVSILIPYYGDRRRQLERSLPFLERQTYPNYETILVDDGSSNLSGLEHRFDKYFALRKGTVPIRSPNNSLRKAFELSDGDFIICSQPELLIPFDAVEKMLSLSNHNRRNVATQYHLTAEALVHLDGVLGWQHDFKKIKSIPGFMSITTPWAYTNINAPTYRNHFSFSGSTRERFEKYLIPQVEEWGMEDVWVYKKEVENGEPCVPIEIETYHQEHDRVYGTIPEYSVRIQRIRNALY